MARGSASAKRFDNPYYRARIELGKSPQEIAEAVNCDLSTIYKIERGELIPKNGLEIALANVLSLAVGARNAELSSATGYVEKIVGILRNTLPSGVGAATISQRTVVKNILNEKDLETAIMHLLTSETQHSDGRLRFLWTGRNYSSFSPFYESALYPQGIIPLLNSGAGVTHYIRDCEHDQKRLDLVSFLLEKILSVKSQGKYSALVVNNLMIQPYTADIYMTRHSGALVAFTGNVFGQPSLGFLSNEHNDVFKEYMKFVASNAEERVAYFPQNRRNEFFKLYLTTESRTGEWVMMQRNPASGTRPLVDFNDGTPWSERTLTVQQRYGHQSIEDMMEMRRISGRLFRDRLSKNRFRQIMSREAIDHWVETHESTDLDGIIPEKLTETTSEMTARLKHIVGLIDDTNGNFQVAIVQDSKMSKLGWSQDRSKNISWVVQGEQATIIEGCESSEMDQDLYRVIVSDPIVNSNFTKAFDEVWRALGSDTDQLKVREYLLQKISQLK